MSTYDKGCGMPALAWSGEAAARWGEELDRLAGYNVSLDLEDGRRVDAVMVGSDREHGMIGVRFYRVDPTSWVPHGTPSEFLFAEELTRVVIW